MLTRTCRDFQYQFLLPKMRNHWEADQWCTKNFGKRWSVTDNRQGVWCCFWKGRAVPGSYEWFFANERDANWFILRWGGQ